MQIGILSGFSGTTTPEWIAETGRLAEERGIHSIWAPEHVVFFREHRSRYPYSADGRIPGDPQGLLEPFTTLSYLAAHTSRIRLGTGVCLLPQRNPVYTARQAADVDYLSGGRFEFGIGIGWQREEFEALGVPWEQRAARAREYIEVMRRLWSDPVVPFSGEFYQLPECIHGPKPVQKPHPPLFFGGESEGALRRVAELGDGWFGFNLTPTSLAPLLKRLDELLDVAGRSRENLRIYVSPYTNTVDPDVIRAFTELGVEQVILPFFARDGDEAKRRLDGLAALGAAV